MGNDRPLPYSVAHRALALLLRNVLNLRTLESPSQMCLSHSRQLYSGFLFLQLSFD